jgi:DNA repair exonuclease SbcCD ATPase subunit
MQEIRFDDKSPCLWQIIGKNGHGKSSLIRILKLALYQEADGVPQDEIANQINGNAYIEIGLQSKSHSWVIITQFKPNKIRVFKDGNTEPEDWGGLTDTKKKIREEIVTIPLYIFNNAISLSINSFKSFLNMKAKDSRNIRDRIFGFYIINEMTELLSAQANKVHREVESMNITIQTIDSNLKIANEEYTNLKNKITEENKIKKQTLSDELALLKSGLEILQKQKNDIDAVVDELGLCISYLANELKKQEIKKMRTELTEIKNESKTLIGLIDEKKEEVSKLEKEADIVKVKESLNKLTQLNKQLEQAKGLKVDVDKKYDALKAEMVSLEENISKAKKHSSLVESRNVLLINVTNLHTSQIAYKGIVEEQKNNDAESIEWNGNLTKLNNSITIADEKIKQSEQSLKIYENKQCPSCQSDLTGNDHQNLKSEIETTLQEQKEKIQKWDVVKKQTEKKIQSIESKKLDIQKRKSSTHTQIVSLKSSINDADIIFAEVKRKLIDNINLLDDESVKIIDIGELSDAINKLVPDDKTLESIDIETENKNLELKKNEFNSVKQQKEENDLSISSANTSIITLDGSIDKKIDRNSIASTVLMFESLDKYSDKKKEITEFIDKEDKEQRTKEQKASGLEREIEIMEKSLEKPEAFKSVLENPKYNSIINSEEAIRDEISKEENKINTLTSDITTKNEDISRTEIKIEELGDESNIELQIQSVKTTVDRQQNELNEQNQKLEKLQKNSNFFNIVEYVLSDEGIKTYILKDIIPSINSEIGNILSLLDVPIVVLFDEEFTVHLYRYGKEISLSTVSDGQKKMIDSSILLAITKILKTKYSSINVVFYDEIFSSVDGDNRATLLEILMNMCCKQLGLHTFVINHSYLPSSYFGYVISVVHKNNFSELITMTQEDYESRGAEVSVIAEMSEPNIIMETMNTYRNHKNDLNIT